MNYERVILEMLNRISILEEKVALIKGLEENLEQENEDFPAISKKYRLLSDYLYNNNNNKISLSFIEINQILGFNLPKSAYSHRAFWANTTSHSIALSWLGVGYETVDVDMEKQNVTFEKKRVFK